MRFHLRKRRQPPAVIIVAMIDVLIVVLIFLMVTTTFKKSLPAFKLVLPEASQATQEGASENPPVAVIIEADGNLRYGPDALSLTLDHLRTELAAAALKNPQLKMVIKPDKKAPVGQLVKVMDVAKEAKVKSLDIAIQPVAQRQP